MGEATQKVIAHVLPVEMDFVSPPDWDGAGSEVVGIGLNWRCSPGGTAVSVRRRVPTVDMVGTLRETELAEELQLPHGKV